MGRRKDLSPSIIAQTKILISTRDYSNRNISRRLKISEASVRRIKAKLDSGQDITPKRKRKCGRKPIFTPRAERCLTKICLENRFATTKHIKSRLYQSNINVSERTIRRKLKELGFRSCRPVRKPKLTVAMKSKRLQWAREHKDRNLEFWKSVFSLQIV